MCGGTIICRGTRKETFDNRVGKAEYIVFQSNLTNNKHSGQTMHVSITHMCCMLEILVSNLIGTNW